MSMRFINGTLKTEQKKLQSSILCMLFLENKKRFPNKLQFINEEKTAFPCLKLIAKNAENLLQLYAYIKALDFVGELTE